jgi:glucosylceramidase
MQSLFDPNAGIGIGILRQPMGASDFSASGDYSYDDVPAGQSDPNLAQFLHRARPDLPDPAAATGALDQPIAQGTRAALESARMDENQRIDEWRQHCDHRFSDLAQYFTRFIDAYQQQGIPIYAVSMQNEPLNSTGSYPSAYVDSSDEANFIGSYLGPALAGAGLGGVKIFGYEHNWDQPSIPRRCWPIARHTAIWRAARSIAMRAM